MVRIIGHESSRSESAHRVMPGCTRLRFSAVLGCVVGNLWRSLCLAGGLWANALMDLRRCAAARTLGSNRFPALNWFLPAGYLFPASGFLLAWLLLGHAGESITTGISRAIVLNLDKNSRFP